MRKVYAAFVDCFKEKATEMLNAPKQHCKQTILINNVAQTILKLDKITKFINIYEMLEDFGDFLQDKVCLVI